MTFTSTNVPKFAGVTSWDQYRQMFDVRSNGWDNVTAALQLLSHLEGDALNVALLVPASRRASRVGLVEALSAHYGSPGRLADYRRQFERTTRTSGEDPSIFATALETLAIKAFGDMGQMAQLRIIRDRFIAGHRSYDDIWIVCHQRRLCRILLIDAGCGRVMWIFGGPANWDRTRHIQPMRLAVPMGGDG